MSPADILAALGGYKTVAERLSLSASTVYYWGKRGSIPNRFWKDLLALAADLAVPEITAEVLVAAHQAAHAA